MITLDLDVVSPFSAPAPLRFEVGELVLGGYTARDAEARDAHIDELRAIGIEPPEQVPAFWPVSPSLVSTRGRLAVQGSDTSGEVEFVLLFGTGETYVGVGSDQTDRALERYSIPRSKQVCGKVIGPAVVRLSEVREVWDEIVLTCEVRDADGSWRPYQRASLASVLPPEQLIAGCYGAGGSPPGAVLMSGTVPLLDGVTRYARQYRCGMHVPGLHEEVAVAYAVDALPAQRAEMAGSDPRHPGIGELQ